MTLKKNLIRKSYLFILFPVLTCSLFYYFGKVKVSPKKYEKVQAMISCLNLNNKLLEESIMNTNKVDVKEIDITFSIYGSDSMDLVFNTVYKEMDLLIFPKSFLDKNIEDYSVNFAILNDNLIKKYISDYSTYSYNNNIYGVKVYDSISNEGWCDSIIKYSNENFNEDYYMFFVKGSINLGELSSSNYDNAFTFMKALYEYE